jgi:hypothetical protein
LRRIFKLLKERERGKGKIPFSSVSSSSAFPLSLRLGERLE